jgi:hypothetical protein
MPKIRIEIDDSDPTQAPLVTVQSGVEHLVHGDSDSALVSKAMLQSAAYMFAKGLPVRFGREVPVEVLK